VANCGRVSQCRSHLGGFTPRYKPAMLIRDYFTSEISIKKALSSLSSWFMKQ
jgi:hypothetical protein